MTYRPTRVQAIRMLKDLVKVLEADGAQAAHMAQNLARATGLPARTLGDGGSRGTSGDDSTSSAALRMIDRGADRYENADIKLDELMAKVVVEAEVLRLYIADLTAHAVAEEQHEGEGYVRPTRAGEGECLGCGRKVPGTEGDRLRGGACSACAMAWTRYQEKEPNADRVVFMRNRPRHDHHEHPAPVDPTNLSLSVEMAATGSAAKTVESTRWHKGVTAPN